MAGQSDDSVNWWFLASISCNIYPPYKMSCVSMSVVRRGLMDYMSNCSVFWDVAIRQEYASICLQKYRLLTGDLHLLHSLPLSLLLCSSAFSHSFLDWCSSIGGMD